MTVQTTVSQLMEVALRIRELREIMGFSAEEMAKRTGVSEEQYLAYEMGAEDLPFTFLHKCARALGVELIQLLEGHTAKLSSYTVTRKGMGLVTASEDGIMIQNMAAMFRQKLATPYWVTYQYSPQLQHQPIHTTTHGGQEFDLVVKGRRPPWRSALPSRRRSLCCAGNSSGQKRTKTTASPPSTSPTRTSSTLLLI